MIGMSALYCDSSIELIAPHLLWHLDHGVGHICAAVHNPGAALLAKINTLKPLVQDSVDFYTHWTVGALTAEEQVLFTNNNINILLAKKADYIVTADDDEFYSTFIPRIPILHYKGYCYHATCCDLPGDTPITRMLWRDDGLTYPYAKVGFRAHLWSGSMQPGLHWLRGQDAGIPRASGIIHHYTYRAGKKMFDHRLDVKYEVLDAKGMSDKRLQVDCMMSDWWSRKNNKNIY